jgi:hypothetical protein
VALAQSQKSAENLPFVISSQRYDIYEAILALIYDIIIHMAGGIADNHSLILHLADGNEISSQQFSLPND